MQRNLLRAKLVEGQRRLLWSRKSSTSSSGSEPCLKEEMVNCYKRCNGQLEELESMIGESGGRNVVFWTAMVAGLVKQEFHHESLLVFHQMQLQGVAANRVTLMTALTACFNLGLLRQVRGVHSHIVESGLESDLAISASLVNIYGRIGDLSEASAVFQQMSVKSVIASTAMMSACVHRGEFSSALLLFREMQLEHRIANRVTFLTVLNSCTNEEALVYGIGIHKLVVESGFDSDVPVATAVMSMYGRCGSVERAKLVFDRMHARNIITWNAMLAAFAQNGCTLQSLFVLRLMDLEGVRADRVTWLSILVGVSDADDGKVVHVRILESGIQLDCVLATALLNMYSKAGCVNAAGRIFFHDMSFRSRVSWNAMLRACSQAGLHAEVLQLSREMKLDGVMPNEVTLLTCINACGALEDLAEGELVRDHMKERGYVMSSNIFATAVLTCYRRCGNMVGAREVFDGIQDPDLMLWGSMISGYADCGRFETAFVLFWRMQLSGVLPSHLVIITMINLCAAHLAVIEGEKLHSTFLQQEDTKRDLVLANALLDMYGKFGKLEEAVRIFREIDAKDSVSWTTLVASLCDNDRGEEALQLFREMEQEGVMCTNVTFITLLSSSCCKLELQEVKLIENCMAEVGRDSNGATALINCYGKCGDLDSARRVFREMGMHRVVVAWNNVISLHHENDMVQQAYLLFLEMLLSGVKPENITFITVLRLLLDTSKDELSLFKLRMVHRCIEESGLEADLLTANALINMFGKLSRVDEAQRVFNAMAERCKVSWTAILAVHAQNQQPKMANFYFRLMLLEGIKPDRVTFKTLLHTCSTAADTGQGRLLHEWIRESTTLQKDPSMAASLVNMYSKCGSLENGRRIFESVRNRSLLLWTTIISAYAQHGAGDEALRLFTRMQQEGVRTDGVTMTSVLSACTRAGLLERGLQYFVWLSDDYGVVRDVEHYNCTVDLLGRSGMLEEAEELLQKMPCKASAKVLMSLMNSCQLQGNVELGKVAGKRVNSLDASIPAGYVTMSNILSTAANSSIKLLKF